MALSPHARQEVQNMYRSNYELEVLINGSPVKEYYKDSKVYIEGRKGAEFSLRIRNNGYRRILAIPTVDGLSVMDGKEASYNSSGYIVSGYSSVNVDGWRTSDKDVAKFYFTDPQDSYSERKDRKNNLGIIGVAVFRELEHIYTSNLCDNASIGPWNIPATASGEQTRGSSMNLKMMSSMNNNQMLCSAQASSAPSDLGTGFGESKRSEVVSVSFERENNPDALFEIYYNTRYQLERLGVDFGERPRYVSPQAFPNRYCEPPR